MESHGLLSPRMRLHTAWLMLVCVAGIASVATAQSVTGGIQVAPAAPASPRTVVVLPFANISGHPADDWIGIGIAETVTTDAERMGRFSVVRRGALLDALDGTRLDARVLSDEATARRLASGLGASWMVAGGFQRLGDQLRITARIVEVETGMVLDTVMVDGRFDEMFALQDRAGARLAARLVSVSGGDAAPVTAAASAAGDPTGRATGREEQRATLPPAGSSPSPDRDSREPRPAAGIGAPADLASGGIAIGGRPLAAASAPVAGNAGALAGRVTVRPVRVETPPTLDGLLDDAVWRDAARITEFVQREPVDGAPASEDSDVYLAYDDANIYLGFHARYENPGMMRANRVDRDRAGFGDDTFSVYFDTFLDQQRAYVFSVNGYGVQGDSIVGGRGGGGRGGGRGGGGGGGGGPGGGGIPRGDSSWDALFSSAGQPVADGFTAEMAIPFKSLRYPARGGGAPHTWGFQIVRQIRGKDETVVWSPVSRDIAGFLPQMGVLDGLTGLSTSRNLEVQPTFTAFRFGTLNEDTGQVVDGDPKPEVGANFKYGVTPNLIADFTLNPDFSQIESDRPQVEVNQRFALFFPELRPFFLEGAEIFQIQAPVTVVHTRTIVDPLYGAKLTGKTGKTTLGVLFASDEGASLSVDDPLDPAFGQPAQTFVGRLRYDLYSESFIGAIVTDREYLDGYSRLVGMDSNFRVGATHQFGFRALRTDRRDTVDSLRTDGYTIDVGFRKRGRNLSYSIDGFALSPDFQTDVGFVRRTNQRQAWGGIEYEWWPQSWVLSWGPELRYGRNYSFDNVLEDEKFRAAISADFAKNIRYNFDISQDLEQFQGIDFEKRRYGMFGNINTSRVISVGGGFDWGDEVFFDSVNPFLGRESGFRTFINFRPSSRFATNINLTTSRFTDPLGLFLPGVNEGERDENGQIFNVNIFRALNTYQFSDRLLLRNILEFDTHDETLGLNFLLTYRVNSGTAFYVGYDDHYQQRVQFDDQVNITGRGYRQTNRAVFTKIQYLFRY